VYIKKRNLEKKVYYYVVENKLVDGKPTMKHILYLGTIEKILKVFNWKKS
jgi:hypothetical protein